MREELKPHFGDTIENGWASEDNPTRTGFFVREGLRTGHMNPGRYFEVTDGKGKFWELPLDRDHKITVPAKPPQGDVGADSGLAAADRTQVNPTDCQTSGGGA